MEGFQLSFNQQDQLKLTGFQAGYTGIDVAINGVLDKNRLEWAVNAIFEKHDVLRTNYQESPGIAFPLQVVEESVGITLKTVSNTERERLTQYLNGKSSICPMYFQVNDWNVLLFEIASEQFILHVGGSSLSTDFWSLNELIKELFQAYQNELESEDLLQYLQFSEWNRSLIEDEPDKEATTFWEEMDEAVGKEALPILKVISEENRQLHIVKAVAQDAAPKKETNALVAWQLLLDRHFSGAKAMSLIRINGREYEEFHQIQGLFSKHVPLTWEVKKDQTIREWSRSTEAELEIAKGYADYFNLNIDESKVEQIKEVSTVFEFNHWKEITCPNLDINLSDYFYTDHIAALRLEVTALKDELRVSVQTLAGNEKVGDILAAQYLKAWSESREENKRTGDINLLTESAKKEIASVGQGEKVKLEYSTVLHAIMAQYSNKTALCFKEKEVSFEELIQQSKKVASLLKNNYGIRAQDRIGIQIERSNKLITLLLSIWENRAVFVPIHTGYPEEKVAQILQEAKVKLFIHQEETLPELPFRTLSLADLEEETKHVTESFNGEWQALQPTDTAYIIFTSGTTGKPKGVEIKHATLNNYVQWAAHYYFQKAGGNFPFFTSFAFDLTLTSLFVPLVRGQRIYIYSEAQIGEQLQRIFFENPAIDAIKLTPSHLRLLESEKGRSTNIQTVILGGEALRSSDLELLFSMNSTISIYNEYGPTEATIGCAISKLTNSNASPNNIGKPINNTVLTLLNKRLNPVAMGEVGEIFIGGEGLAEGYFQQPKLTQEKFLTLEVFDNQRFYRTGDLAFMDSEGDYHFLGRNDRQVKINGNRVELGDISAALERHTALSQSHVIFHNQETLVAYFTTQNGALVEDESLTRFLETKVPDYMIPHLFLEVPAIPLTQNGKADESKLPGVEEIRNLKRKPFKAPETKVEQLLASLWMDLLGVEKVSANDHFTRLGGDSIKAIQLVSRLRQKDYELDIKDAMTYPVLGEMAQRCKILTKRFKPTKIASGAYNLSLAQQRFFEISNEHLHHYNQSLIINQEEHWEEQILKESVAYIWAFHDILRSVFEKEEVWQGRILAAEETIPFEYFDCTQMEDGDSFFEKKERLIQSSFDLSKGPLIQFALFRFKNFDKLLIVAHHLITDGVSWRILPEDLRQVYHHLKNGEAVNLPASASFFDWTNVVENYAHSNFQMVEERAYWEETIVGNNTLPFIKIPKSNQHSHFRSIHEFTNEETSNLLLKEANEAYNTNPFDLMMTALSLTLDKYIDTNDQLITLENHGRDALDTALDFSSALGWFTTLFPMKLKLFSTTQIGDSIKTIKEAIRNIPSKGIGYGILKYLKKDGAANHPMISFNYLGQMNTEAKLDETSFEEGFKVSNISNEYELKEVLHFTIICINGRFNISLSYNYTAIEDALARKILDTFIQHLNQIVTHCTSLQTQELTVSDIDFQGFSQGELEDFLGDF